MCLGSHLLLGKKRCSESRPTAVPVVRERFVREHVCPRVQNAQTCPLGRAARLLPPSPLLRQTPKRLDLFRTLQHAMGSRCVR